MKKILAMVLAMMLVLSMSVAFAEDEWNGIYADSTETSFTITKTYTSTEDFVPGETLSFTIEPAYNTTTDSEGNEVKTNANPDTTMISIGTNNSYTVTGLTNTITVTVPSYDTVGEYNYTIKEDGENTAGVTSYDTGKTIYVTVLVEYDNVNHKLVIGNDADPNGTYYFIKKDADNTKTSIFNNEFKTNDFTIDKDVRGNMANENDTFKVKATLTTTQDVLTTIKVAGEDVAATEWVKTTDETTGVTTYTYTTKELTISESGAAVTIADVPYDVSVSVAEVTDDDEMNGYTLLGYITDNAKNEDGTEKIDSTATFTIDATKHSVIVVNNKTATVATGISLDNAPYMILMGLVVLAGAALIVKRASANR